MSHYERRLQADLDALRADAVDIGRRVTEAVRLGVEALVKGDRDLAGSVVLGDHPINRDVRALDQRCHVFVARHLPSAGPLRVVSSVLRLNIGLERIGDYAVTLGRETLQLTTPMPAELASQLRTMAEESTKMLEQAMHAWANEKPGLAAGTKQMSSQIDAEMSEAFTALLEYGQSEDAAPLRDMFAMLLAFNRVERVSDQAKNICEEAIFAATGETKAPKRYKILFVDEHNSALSALAEAFARRAFPESGIYKSQGWSPAAQTDPRALKLAEDRGMDIVTGPQPLGTLPAELDDYHVIVSLAGDLRPHVPLVPFQTLVVEWDICSHEQAMASDEALLECFGRISAHVHELMVTLRGEEAS